MLFVKLSEAGVLEPLPLMLICTLLCIFIPYLLGSFNFGVIISGKLYRDDVRRRGSGSAGTTNMLRNYGKKAAVLTLVGDALKTAAACGFGILIYGTIGVYLAGLFSILGHMFPLYFKFKGGKGIICLAVTVLITDWRVFLILFSIFLIIVIGTRYVSLGSVIGSVLYPVVLNMLNNTGLKSVEFISVIIAALVVFMHRANIKRLLDGNENKLSFKSKQKTEQESGSNGK